MSAMKYIVKVLKTAYCLMQRSVTFDFQFALGIDPSDITSPPCLTAHASNWLITRKVNIIFVMISELKKLWTYKRDRRTK